MDDFGWVATGSDDSQDVTILERCAAKCIEWPPTWGLQIGNGQTESALFTHRQGHKRHLRPKLTAKIRVRNWFTRFNWQTTHRLGV